MADPGLISRNNSAQLCSTMLFITLKKYQGAPHACLFVFGIQLTENPSGTNFPATAWWQWKLWSMEVFSRNRLTNFWTALVRINVTLRRVHQTVVAVEKQYYVFWLCVDLVIQHEKHKRRGLSGSYCISLHYLINGTIVEKKCSWTNNACSNFLHKFLLKYFSF